MKLVYVAGPYRSATEFGVLQNIRAAEAVALQVWKTGCACICPHKNTAFFGGEADDELWLQGDMEMLRRCDAVVCVDGWATSYGSHHEVAVAHTLSIPVFCDFEDFERWAKDC